MGFGKNHSAEFEYFSTKYLKIKKPFKGKLFSHVQLH